MLRFELPNGVNNRKQTFELLGFFKHFLRITDPSAVPEPLKKTPGIPKFSIIGRVTPGNFGYKLRNFIKLFSHETEKTGCLQKTKRGVMTPPPHPLVRSFS